MRCHRWASVLASGSAIICKIFSVISKVIGLENLATIISSAIATAPSKIFYSDLVMSGVALFEHDGESLSAYLHWESK